MSESDNSHSSQYDEQYEEIVPQNSSQIQKILKNDIRMPQIIQIKKQEQLFKKYKYPQNQDISNKLKKCFEETRKQLNQSFMIYKDPQNFQFQFPDSKFPDVPPNQVNDISYQQKNIIQDQDTFKNSLSVQQIKQIWETGEFKVKSQVEYIDLPYVWKINDLIFRGKKTIIQYWRQGICNAYDCLCLARTFLIHEIPRTLFQFIKFPNRFFSLIFGKASRTIFLNVNYQHQVMKDFWQEVMNKHYVECKQWGSPIWQYLKVDYKAEIFENVAPCNNYQEQQEKQKVRQNLVNRFNKQVSKMNEKKNKIISVHNQFDKNWNKIRKKILQEASQSQGFQMSKPTPESEEQKNIEEALLKELSQRKFQMYVNHLKQKLPQKAVPMPVIQALIALLYIFRIISVKTNQFIQDKQNARKNCQENISKKYKIRSLNYEFFNKKIDELYDPQEKQITKQFYENLYQDKMIKDLTNKKQKQVYKLYVNFHQNFKEKVQAKKKQIKILQVPKRVFYSSYHLLPPYELKQTERNPKTYYLKKQQGMTIDTRNNFWKLHLYAMRIKSWTINCVVFLIYQCWKGPFGLRRLYGLSQFNFEHQVEYKTGKLSYSQKKPFLGHFKKVLEGIKKSRQQFQSQPDRGLFGKNLIRVLNYAECYLFRFLFVGCFLVLFCYPCAIIVNSIFSAILITLFWIWVPIIIIVTYLFNILIFQFESSWVPHGIIIRSFPLLSLLFSIIILVLKLISFILGFLIVLPLCSLLVVIFSLFMRYYRTFTDFIMLLIISKLGRTPSKNSVVAKKISGPGMSRNYYMSINEEDVYILTQSQIQKIQMHQIEKHTRKNLTFLKDKFHTIINIFLTPYKTTYNYQQNLIDQNGQKLTNNFNKQFRQYMARYPKRPKNIRFTMDQIDNCFDNCIKIVKNFVLKKDIGNWVFDHYNLLDGTYDQLTRIIWIQIFGCGEQIFEPLEKLDQRFKLQDQYNATSFGKGKSMKMKKNVRSVMDALEGQVSLSHQKVKLSPYNHNLLTRDAFLMGIQQIFNLQNQNSLQSIYLPSSYPQCLFVPHSNINELIKKQMNDRSYTIRLNEKTIIWE